MKKISYYITKILQIICRPVKWFAASFQGNDGKASGKKFTAAFLTALAGNYSAKVNDAYSLYAFIALLVTILMMWGIISSHNIITFTRALKLDRKESKD